MKLRQIVLLSVAVLLVGAGSSVSAGLLGANVNACWNTVYSGSVTTDTSACDTSTVGFGSTSATVVDPGVEFLVSGGSRWVDFTDTTVTVTYSFFSGSPSPDLFIFTDLPETVTGLTLLSTNGLSVTTEFSGKSLALLVGSPDCCSDSEVSVRYQIETNGGSPIPEPGTYAMALVGLAAAGVARWRSRVK